MSLRTIVMAVALPATAAAADIPLRVSDVATGSAAHVRLTNTSNQPVTAWSIAVITRGATGSHREVYTADGYLSEATHGIAGSTERLERLMPGESRQIPLDAVPDGAT